MTNSGTRERDLVREMVRDGLVSVDASVTDPVLRTALLAVAVERWWANARLIREALRMKEMPR